MHRYRVVHTLLMLCAVSAQGLRAQLRQDPSRALVLERVTEDRWIHEGQHLDFVPFERVNDHFQVRFRRSRALEGTRTLTLTLRNLEARLSLDPRNRFRSAILDMPRLSYRQYQDARDRADARRRRLTGPGATLNLPAARYWDVPFVLPGREMSTGLTWTDTLSFLADPGEGLSETLDGVWEFRVVGDTTIEGRTLPLVRTEAQVRYTSVEVIRDYAMVEPLQVEREVAGIIRGWAVVDTVIGVRSLGADTAVWNGTAVLRIQDGRSVSSEVRYERVRSWVLRDSTVWAARQDSLRAVRRAQRTGMLVLPRNAVEERLRQGDSLLADSLVGAWRDTPRVQTRLEIENLLRRWVPRSSAEPVAGLTSRQDVEDLIGALRLEAGDTAFAIVRTLTALGPSPRLTLRRLDQLLPYYEDLGRLWKLGVLPRFIYEELAGQMLGATLILEPDSSLWECEPAACEQIRVVGRSASERRLRDVALVSDFAQDPARFYRELLARADAGSLIVEDAIGLANGVGATWAAAANSPVPESGADWRAWLAWLGGVGRFSERHRAALDMHRARTGRDAIEELRVAWPPQGDSAQLVVSEILLGMGVLERPTIDEVAEAFLSGSEARLQGARAELRWIVGPDAPEASPELALELLLPSLDSALIADSFHGIRGLPVFILDEDLPAGLGWALADRAQVIDSETWAARPLRLGGVIIRVEPVRTNGPFAMFSWNWAVYQRRLPNEAPSGYSGGLTRWLLRTDEGWRTVRTSSWIT